MTDRFVARAIGLSKSFGKKRALDSASMEISAGTIDVLLGRNGSGKTTLAKILAGVLRPDEGRVEIPDDLAGDRIGFLFDTSAHWNALTGEENAWFFARSFGLDQKLATERIASLFQKLALDEVAGDLVSTYSFGMKRKLAIAEAMVHRPRLLILDEPSIGLDLSSRTRLYSLLKSASDEGQAVLIATNDINEAKYLADRVWLMEDGRIITSGSPQELIRGLDKNVMIEVEVGIPMDLRPLKDVAGVVNADSHQEDGRLLLRVMVEADHEGAAVGEIVRLLALQGVGISRMNLLRPDLGDVFLKHLGGGRT